MLRRDEIGCSCRGFSLLEVLVATTIMTVGLAALAQLFILAMSANQIAKKTTIATVLAQQKMEQLRGLTWGFDALGIPTSDTTTDTSVVPERSTGGAGLTPSPRGTLGSNTAGYCDFVNERGQSLGGGTTPPPGTAFVRRWSIESLPADPTDTIVLQVLVAPFSNRGASGMVPGARRLPDEVRIINVKTRKATS